MVLLGYRRRTGFLAGLTVAQISEFSLIFMAMGVTLGHVDTAALGLVTLVGLITIAASTYMITYSHELYARCEPLLRWFERRKAHKEAYEDASGEGDYDIVVFGLGRYGGTIGRRLIGEGRKVLGVDFSPTAVQRWKRDGLPATFGDVSDPEFVAALPVRGAQWILSAIPDPNTGVSRHDSRHALLQALTDMGYEGKIAVATHRVADNEELKLAGAHLVLHPYYDAADR